MPDDRPLRCIVSVHDVMPETLDRVARILEYLTARRVTPVTLLVVPGREWRPAQLDRLRDFERAGFILAGHGWTHQVAARKRFYHKLHGIFLSRMVAEHLALEPPEIRDLMLRCRRWFGDHDLSPPELYVPPAWAMGRISPRTLKRLPFCRYETTRGVYVTAERRLFPLPLAGYEADTALRAAFLDGWNRWNEIQARRDGRPLRVGIHPYDLGYPLKDRLFETLSRADGFCDYRVEASV